MKLYYLLLLTFPLLLSAQGVKEEPRVKNQDAKVAAWIELHRQVLALKLATQELKENPGKENETTFNHSAQKVDLALKALVEQEELVSEQFTYIPSKLSNEQADLLQYCFNSANQVYGKSATHEMFGISQKKYFGIKKQSYRYHLKTRLPKKFNVMLKQILANNDLINIKLPRPVTINNISKSKDLWILFYRNLDRLDDIAFDIKQNKKANPLEAADSLRSMNQALKHLVKNKDLKTKTYPFIATDQFQQLIDLTFIQRKFGKLAMEAMLNIGAPRVVKEALRPAVIAGKLKMNLDDLDQKLTIYLPEREFVRVSQFLDSLKISQP